MNLTALPAMRQVGSIKRDQSGIWEKVHQSHINLSVAACATQSYQTVIEDKSVAEKCRPYISHFSDIPKFEGAVVGVVVMTGGKIQCVDIFATPKFFFRLWPKLVKSYALDALSGPNIKPKTVASDINNFLKNGAASEFIEGTTPGLEIAYDIVGKGLNGYALCYKGDVVHCNLFPIEAHYDNEKTGPKLRYRRDRNDSR